MVGDEDVDDDNNSMDDKKILASPHVSNSCLKDQGVHVTGFDDRKLNVKPMLMDNVQEINYQEIRISWGLLGEQENG